MSNLDNIREGLAKLGDAINTIANTQTPDTPDATMNSISGNAIHGGKATMFRSTGIRDLASSDSLLIENDSITVGNADIDNIVGDLTVGGNLTVSGELFAERLNVTETIAQQKFINTIDFHPANGNLNGQGLQWRQEGERTKQIVWNQDRFVISNNVDLHRNASYQIDNIPVLTANTLGVTILNSSLESVGTLQNLRTTGDVTIDDFIMYDSGTMRFSIGCEAPNAQLSVASNEAEFVVDPDFDHVKVGTYTTSKLSIITDNKERIIIKEHGGTELKGTVGINVAYPGDDVDLQVNGAIRIQDKKIEVGAAPPSDGNFNQGDMIYNSIPTAGNYVGWICVESGNPGRWKAFGAIQS
jgi:hypothetical protein|tara:strand:+ start:1157 stop:2224 length:1068 start_codon:yes stop_codon:yes gene_type:complete